MSFFNYFGFIIIIVLLVPNLIWFLKNGRSEDIWKSRLINLIERTGRYGSILFMIINIPRTFYGFLFPGANYLYYAIISVLAALYLVFWFLFRHRYKKAYAVLLAVIPSAIFLLSGILITSIPLIVFASGFLPSHIGITLKNLKSAEQKNEDIN